MITHLPLPTEPPTGASTSVGDHPTYAATQQAVDHLSDQGSDQLMTSIAVRPHTYDVAGRTRGSGPVLAVLTDAPTDLVVAAHAADLAARTGTLLIAAATVHTTGCSVNALPHHARDRRIRSRSIAIVARITPILHATGAAYFRSTLLVPTGTDTRRALPITAVRRLVDRFGAVAVVAAQPLHDPTGVLQPTPHHDHGPVAVPANTTAERHTRI